VKAGDEREADRDGGTAGDIGGDDRAADPAEERLNEVSKGRLADPAKGKAGESDAELSRRDVAVQMRRLLLQDARDGVALQDELLHPCGAHLDQGELGGHEEAVGAHQRKDRKEAEPRRDSHHRLLSGAATDSSADARSVLSAWVALDAR
jgi:hypothetical protein